ncbi:MAG: hypothetical protein RIQ33_13 [Bacteroidota bacterium]|jgi:O-antigen/teichoic acid export membrane protein
MKQYLHKIFDSNTFKGATLNLLIGQGLLTLLFLLFDFVIARKFTVEIFSTWKQLQILINLILPIVAFGLPEGYKYFIAYEPEKSKLHHTSMIGYLLLLTVFVALISVLFGRAILQVYFHNPLLNNVAKVFALLFCSITINRVLRYQLVNEHKTDVYLKGTVVAIFIAILSLIGIAFFHLQIHTKNIILIFAIIVSIVFLIPSLLNFLLTKHLNFEIDFTLQRLIDYLKIGFPLYLATFMSLIISNLDKTIVSKYTTLSMFGIYAAGALEIPIFSMLSASFSQSTFPKYVALLKENRKQQAIQLWILITNKVSKITYPILLILMIFAKTIFVLIYSTKLIAAVPIFKIFLLICLWRNNYYGSLISASGKTKWITFYSLLNLIIMGLGCWFCFRLFGFKSLPWVIFSSTSFVAIAQLAHEKMLKDFVLKFLFQPQNLLLIILIIAAFIFSPF